MGTRGSRNLGRGIRDFRQSVSGDDEARPAPVTSGAPAEPDLATVVRNAEAEGDAEPAPVARSS